MENTTQEAYSDSPTYPQSTTPTLDASPSSSDSSITIKPLPATPHTPPSYTDEDPYHDDPPTPSHTMRPARRNQSLPKHHRQSGENSRYQSYTDSPPQTPDADDVPLAHLLLSTHSQSHSLEASFPVHDPSYPSEAPPPYAIAVRQSYRDTLVQYVPRSHHASRDTDEESQLDLEMLRPDDVRHSVEKVVAMFVVAALLLIVSGVLGWLALGSGLME